MALHPYLAAVVLLTAGAAPGSAAPHGPYVGQGKPPAAASLFAPGIVNAGMPTRDVALTPDGRELYFSVFVPGFTQAAIVVTRLHDGRWTAPEVAPFAQDARYRSIEPCVAPDGQRFYFASDRPEAGTGPPGPFGIWVMDRTPKGWGEPRRLGAEINGSGEAYFPSVTGDGTLYFTRELPDGTSAIYRARPRAEGYAGAERLPDNVNCGKTRYNAFVAPDESYVIVPVYGQEGSLGGTDYYVVFRDATDRWSAPLNLGPAVNSASNDEFSPFVSRDGCCFFFMSIRDAAPRIAAPDRLTFAGLRAVGRRASKRAPGIYWIDAHFLGHLRERAVFH